MDVNKLMAELERKHPGESEYLQAVREVLTTVEETYNRHPEFEANRIAERIVEPDRSFTFKVVWVDDRGGVQVNTGYRFQFNNAIGPYKGADDTADGRCEGRIGLQPQGQVRRRGDALLPGFHGRAVASHRPRDRRSGG